MPPIDPADSLEKRAGGYLDEIVPCLLPRFFPNSLGHAIKPWIKPGDRPGPPFAGAATSPSVLQGSPSVGILLALKRRMGCQA